MKKLLKKKVCGPINSAWDALVWHKVWETHFSKKKKKKRERNVDAQTSLSNSDTKSNWFSLNQC